MSDQATGAGVGTEEQVDVCAMDNSTDRNGLRIASIFIILVTSLFGTLLPIVLKRSSVVPRSVFEFAKFFGSGVIIATAFMHLLSPAFEALGSECLTGTWTEYDWAPAIAMAGVYGIFFAEIAAYRIGSKRMSNLGIDYSAHQEPSAGVDAHGHSHNHEATSSDGESHSHGHAHGHGHDHAIKDLEKTALDSDSTLEHTPSNAEASAQLIAVAVLEFGVVLHSVIIGLTLAVNEDFVTLFIVLIFHQMFEGLGLGSRLSALHLPAKWKWAPYVAGTFYSLMTPIGVAIGLGVRDSYNGNGAKANMVSGILDSLSAGILLYTGLVELLGHEIVFNPRMMKASTGKLAYVFTCMLLGSGIMALLAKWA